MSDPPPPGAYPPAGAYPPPGPYPPPPAPPRRMWLIPVLVVALAIVVAAVSLTVALLLAGDDDDEPPSGPAVLRRPVQFVPVRAVEPAPCKPGWLPDTSAGECLQMGAGMSIGRVDDIRAQPPDPSRGSTGFTVAITLTRQDAQSFGRLTTTASQSQPPANRIAILAEGQVLSAPQVTTPITGGKVEISGPAHEFTRDRTEGLVRRITGR
ncbi:SecDF P1 head subdomain-containing protein [Spirillospora sp. CA-255316]